MNFQKSFSAPQFHTLHHSKVRRFRNWKLGHVVVAVFAIASSMIPCLAQDNTNGFFARLHESHTRELAIKRVMPSYPEEAVSKNISGVLRLKIEISDAGEVLRIKVDPKSDPLLKKAVADAVRQWRFKPIPDSAGLHRSSLSRLTFLFVIREGVGLVDLYIPSADAPDRERLGYYDSPKEWREWKDWEEVTDQ